VKIDVNKLLQINLLDDWLKSTYCLFKFFCLVGSIDLPKETKPKQNDADVYIEGQTEK
jgi:hypothetical protein